MTKSFVAILFALALAGCAADKVTAPATVDIPIVEHCPGAQDGARPVPPDFPDTDVKLKAGLPFPTALADLVKSPKDVTARAHAQANLDWLARQLAAGRILRDGYITQLETALGGCK